MLREMDTVWLCEAGVSPCPRAMGHSTPLHLAVAGGHVNAIQALLQMGAPFNVQDHDGRTPLFVASRMGLLDGVDLLRKAGASLTPDEIKLGAVQLRFAISFGQ